MLPNPDPSGAPSDELDPEGVEAAAKAIWLSLRGDPDWDSRPAWPNLHWQREQDQAREQASDAITAYLAATAQPREDGLRDKAEQWDAAQPMIAAMTGVVEAARRFHDSDPHSGIKWPCAVCDALAELDALAKTTQDSRE